MDVCAKREEEEGNILQRNSPLITESQRDAHYFCHTQFASSKSVCPAMIQGKGLQKESLGAVLEAVYHVKSLRFSGPLSLQKRHPNGPR